MNFMTDIEIAALKKRAQCGDVYWRDADGRCIRVLGVNLNWVEFTDEPELTEPAAILAQAVPVALYNEVSSAFVVLAPLFNEAPMLARASA